MPGRPRRHPHPARAIAEAARAGIPDSPQVLAQGTRRRRTSSAPRRHDITDTTTTTTAATQAVARGPSGHRPPAPLDDRRGPGKPRARRGGIGGTRGRVWRVCWGAVVGWWGLVVAVAAQAWSWASSRWQRPGQPVRDILLHELKLAEAGSPRVAPEDIFAAGSAAAAGAAVRTRATRAASTEASGRRAVRQVREFLERNPSLLARPGAASHDSYDMLVEAFVYAEEAGAEGQACPWIRARRPHDPSAARGAGAARGLLERLGWGRGSAWTRSRTMGKAWNVRDDADVVHTDPIFAWELVEGLRLRPPRTPWEMAGAALSVVGSLHGKRGGGAKKLKVGEVVVVAPDAVSVTANVRVKERVGASARRKRRGKTFVLRHWLVRKHLLPWIEWHKRKASPASALLFPSITNRRSPQATALGFAAEGQWVEPMRECSPRQVATWLEQFIPNLRGRGFHGWRAGNNMELRRQKEVHDVTRRALHERTLKPLLGSEAHYDEAFAEDFAEATEALGRLRIERGPSGLLTVTATSQSAGEAQDWVGVARPITFAASAADMESSDDEGSSSDEDGGSTPEVVGDAGRSSRRYNCGRCGDAVGDRDYGFMCDAAGCAWGVCTSCHPGGARAQLLCPEHNGHGRR